LWLLLIPILAVFFLKDGEKLSQAMLDVVEPRRQREFLEGVVNDIHHMLAHYIRAQLVLAALAMIAYVAGLNLLRVPYATILGVIGGVWEFIPTVGPLISFLLFFGVALGSGYSHLLFLVVFLAAWRGVEDYVISPRIMEKQLELHPLAVLFGVLAGGEVGGILGVYLSIPVMAAARIFWRRWSAYSRQQASPTR
jgi:predicted PurR-regulated permease PerM